MLRLWAHHRVTEHMLVMDLVYALGGRVARLPLTVCAWFSVMWQREECVLQSAQEHPQHEGLSEAEGETNQSAEPEAAPLQQPDYRFVSKCCSQSRHRSSVWGSRPATHHMGHSSRVLAGEGDAFSTTWHLLHWMDIQNHMNSSAEQVTEQTGMESVVKDSRSTV